MASGLLRHADEQTVVGLAAVLRAVEEGGLDSSGFERWAVVAAPRYLGRTMFFKTAFPQFLAEGAWGVSPHLISNQSLHSASGVISQALRARGPNLGVGGTPGCELEAFLWAATTLDEGTAPAVWVVLSGWGALQPGDAVESGTGEFFGCAVALRAPAAVQHGERLRVLPDAVSFEPPGDSSPARPSLAEWLGVAGGAPLTRSALPLESPRCARTSPALVARDRL